ncbi:hypothetical protein [uncultured Paenalcaligenes sp.]|uniref:hypothetical protein n=1 Tax=uncultured Paenalcaligenes sp. TaxID=1588925 RepID=UPI002631852D|nr:hypothetical protein [uncultured Paenalcaligenes sp.]
MTDMRYEIDEILNESIMTGVPNIIVEGVDDVPIYSSLSSHAQCIAEVYAVESISGFGEGCTHVINAIEDLEEIANHKHDLSTHILGIIDKDVRDFRKELPTSESILTLKYYSIESHFISIETIKNNLHLFIKASENLIDENLCKLMMNEIEKKLLKSYYYSLESLKKSLEKEYESVFSYSFKRGKMKDENIIKKIEEKEKTLDEFATKQGVNKNIQSLKLISNGKWLIDIFSEEVLNQIEKLKSLCQIGSIKKCPSCKTTNYDKCFYRKRDGIHSNTIKSIAMASAEGDNFQYIIERIAQLNQ